MCEINPGIWDGLSPEQARKYYPEEWERFAQDPYAFRAPRAESYHDLSSESLSIMISVEPMAHINSYRVTSIATLDHNAMCVPHSTPRTHSHRARTRERGSPHHWPLIRHPVHPRVPYRAARDRDSSH